MISAAVDIVAMNKVPDSFRAGLIGSGIGASLTPAMHMAEGHAQGFAYQYELLDLHDLGGGPELLPALLGQAEERGFSGLNITYPCKQQVIAHLHELSDDAAMLGAVNTIVLKNGRRYGHNTDWWGFAEGFRRGLPDADLRSVVQLGAGGAGAATAFAILKMRAQRLCILDQEAGRAVALCETMSRHFPQADIVAGADPVEAMREASGLVHATPTGMAKHPGMPLSETSLQPHHWVAEIVYFPLETELLRVAKGRGCRVVNGGGMAVFQAVGAFSLFTGRTPDETRMMRHFETMTAVPDDKALLQERAG
jgi:shikimate dehydrogenase